MSDTDSGKADEPDAVGGAKERSRAGWIIACAIGAVVLIAASVAVAVALNPGSAVQAAATPSSGTVDGELVVVPDVVGMTVAEARAELEEVGLILVIPEDTDEESTVRTQSLGAGDEVSVGTKMGATVEQTAEPAGDSLDFPDGAKLDPLTAVGWQFSLGADDGSWTTSPDAGEGEVIFVNADDTCTAQYWQQTFDTTSEDDRAATDEFLAEISGATEEEMAEFAFDGRFALTGGLDDPAGGGDVATRTLLWSDDESSYLLTARVFSTLDYETSTMSNAYTLRVQCDPAVDPMDVVDSLDDVAKVTVDH